MSGKPRRIDVLQSQINVTPLVDVVLVLLIIFMVIVPLTMRGYDVDIPGEATATAGAPAQEEQIVLRIDVAGCPILKPPKTDGLPDDCRVRLNDEDLPVTDLARRIGEIFSNREPTRRVLFLSAHGQLNYEAVMRIVDVARSGAAEMRIGIVAEPEPQPIVARSV